ncbi:hypothetical protein KAR91_27970 [Candidatus Pacearchaeota archaeon]|nr:hypothetical protein [Candidatus Pacearchaeota archaeon]
MLKKISKMKTQHQVTFFVLIGFAVISFWRGAWGLMDQYISPGNYEISLWISLLSGIAVLGATNYIAKELM